MKKFFLPTVCLVTLLLLTSCKSNATLSDLYSKREFLAQYNHITLNDGKLTGTDSNGNKTTILTDVPSYITDLRVGPDGYTLFEIDDPNYKGDTLKYGDWEQCINLTSFKENPLPIPSSYKEMLNVASMCANVLTQPKAYRQEHFIYIKEDSQKITTLVFEDLINNKQYEIPITQEEVDKEMDRIKEETEAKKVQPHGIIFTDNNGNSFLYPNIWTEVNENTRFIAFGNYFILLNPLIPSILDHTTYADPQSNAVSLEKGRSTGTLNFYTFEGFSVNAIIQLTDKIYITPFATMEAKYPNSYPDQFERYGVKEPFSEWDSEGNLLVRFMDITNDVDVENIEKPTQDMPPDEKTKEYEQKVLEKNPNLLSVSCEFWGELRPCTGLVKIDIWKYSPIDQSFTQVN